MTETASYIAYIAFYFSEYFMEACGQELPC